MDAKYQVTVTGWAGFEMTFIGQCFKKKQGLDPAHDFAVSYGKRVLESLSRRIFKILKSMQEAISIEWAQPYLLQQSFCWPQVDIYL